MKRILIATALAFAILSSAHSGTVAGFGGATEITQLLNNVELAGQTLKQATLVEGQITANLQSLQQYVAMLKQLKQLDPATLSQTIAPFLTRIDNLKKTYFAVKDLSGATRSARDMFNSRIGEMNRLGMTPGDYLTMESALAARKGGIYKQQMEQDLAVMDNMQARSEQLNAMANTQIEGDVQGLQLLNQHANMLTGEMMELKAAVIQQNLVANQDLQDRAATTAAANVVARKNADTNTATEQRNVNAGDTGQSRPLVEVPVIFRFILLRTARTKSELRLLVKAFRSQTALHPSERRFNRRPNRRLNRSLRLSFGLGVSIAIYDAPGMFMLGVLSLIGLAYSGVHALFAHLR